jgi:uncharacterized protein
MIIDAHAHVSATSQGATELYLKQLEVGGIQQGVICPGGMIDVQRMNDYVVGKAKPSTVPRNDYVDDALNKYPQLHGLGCVNPLDPGAVEELERLFVAGRRGLMITPIVHPFSFGDPEVAALASLCADHDVPLYSHVAYRPGALTSDFLNLARQFPKTNFILEHMGMGPSDELAAIAAAEVDNFFVESSLCSYLQALNTVKKAGVTKILFGSEYPLSHPALELEKILLLPVSDDERDKILSGNARALLGLVCA